MILLDELLRAGGRLAGEAHAREFVDFSFDSRQTRPGELFLALRTARADGHDYIPDALAAGASGVVCSWPPEAPGDTTVVLAEDPEALIARLASFRLAQLRPRTIAVTGSVGKTSTVRAITAVLAGRGPVLRTRQSFNTQLGISIALGQLSHEHRYAVLEFGTDRFGDIGHLVGLFPPEIGVVTSVGEAHLKTLGSLEGVAREKGALVQALPADGWAVLNGDNPHVAAMRERTRAQVLTFGWSPGCDLRVSEPRLSLEGTRLRLHWRDESVEASIPLLGEPAIAIALAAAATGLACGLSLDEVAEGLARVERTPGRLYPVPARGGATLLDDTFNAALPSVRAALRTLGQLPARRRIVVLGDVSDVELNVDEAYAELGGLAGGVADQLICKGDWCATATNAARATYPELKTTIVHTATEALRALPEDLGPGDLVLVKGSPEARMERISAGLLGAGLRAEELLVRQAPAWHRVRIGTPGRPTWVRVDLDAIAHNVRRLREIADVPLMAVLKADAYGHGAIRVARTVLGNGATAVAVATLGEAAALRGAGIDEPILVLGYTAPWQAREAIRLHVTCTVFDLDAARAFSEAARALEQTATLHVKVDTGMARLGLRLEEAAPFLAELARLPALHVEGLYSHFATADSADERFARLQLERFQQVLGEISAARLRPPIVHAANSAGMLRFPEARFDMVRPGIACYGLNPSAETPLPEDLRPALSFHTEVAQAKDYPAGVPLSYGCTFVTSRPSRIATIPVGYADGFRRSPPWREVLVRGRRAPVVGRICMDYALIDVTEIEGVKRGDPVLLIGAQGGDRISADEVAGWLGTINYEVVSTILPRVPREVE